MFKSKLERVKSFVKSPAAKGGIAAGVIVAAGSANAAGIDVADVLAVLAAAVVTVTSVCAAGLSIVVVTKVYKYVRGAF